MTRTQQPGWYDDPTGEAELRWWDGAAWTTHTDTRAPAAGRRSPSVVWWIVAGLVLVAGGAGGAAILIGGDGDTPASADDTRAPGTSDARDATTADEPAGDPTAELDDDVASPADDGAASGTEHDLDDGLDPAAPADDVITIDFDGVCAVEVDRVQAESGDLRAWNEGCDTAPILLAPDESRWIVVVSSLNGADFTLEDARDRARDVGLPGSVLWSSHYPSLNPDLWVVYTGPFGTEDRAAEVAGSRADGSYARVLSDDDGDRYCVAADGCLGERGN